MDEHVYLFIATANQSGSTLLQHAFSECNNVANLGMKYHKGHYLIDEGHEYCKSHMPAPAHTNQGLVWTEVLGNLRNPSKYNIDGIRYEWNNRWIQHPAFHRRECVLLEKSPHNLGRIKILADNFSPAYFIIQVRNPYAVAEGVNRRGSYSFDRCAHHAAKSLLLAKEALTKYENILCWNYEILSSHKRDIEELVRGAIPYCEDFTLDMAVPANSIDGFASVNVSNFNRKQFARLNEGSFKEIDNVLQQYEEVMNFFGYERMTYEQIRQD